MEGTEPRPGGPAAGTPHAERICDAFATHLRRTCADSLLRGQQTLDGRQDRATSSPHAPPRPGLAF